MKSKCSEIIQLFRIFLIVMIVTFLTTVLLGVALATFNPAFKLPTGKAANIQTNFFSSILSVEIPQYQAETHAFDTKKITNFFLTLLLDIDLNDNKTLIAGVIPGMDTRSATLLHPGNNSQERIDYPEDDEQSFEEGSQSINDHPKKTVSENSDSNDSSPISPSDNKDHSIKDNNTKTPIDNIEPEILIYHSHNRESWLPELPHIKKDFLAFDKKMNITLLGDRLSKKLSAEGINSLHDTTDYQFVHRETYKNTNSYLYSRKNVKEAMVSNKEIKYFFDIHRDSGPRKTTTTTIDGKDYAQLYIVIGAENPKWKENTKFAKEFIDILDKKYPGLSKGIFAKDHTQGDGVYNQDLSIKSMIIEVGGVHNTLEESYRTIDALAKVITDLYKNDKNITEVNSSL